MWMDIKTYEWIKMIYGWIKMIYGWIKMIHEWMDGCINKKYG